MEQIIELPIKHTEVQTITVPLGCTPLTIRENSGENGLSIFILCDKSKLSCKATIYTYKSFEDFGSNEFLTYVGSYGDLVVRHVFIY